MTLIDPRIITALRAATRVVVFTGAGVSAESDIPTFRDKQTDLREKLDAAQLATPDASERDPASVWGWYEWRLHFFLATMRVSQQLRLPKVVRVYAKALK
jgi:NAD-dependent deacetylase